MGTKHVGTSILCRGADTGVPVPMCASVVQHPMCVSDIPDPQLRRSTATAFFLRSSPHMGTGTLVRAPPHKLPDPTCFDHFSFKFLLTARMTDILTPVSSLIFR